MIKYYFLSIIRLLSSSFFYYLLIETGISIFSSLLLVLLYGILFFMVQVKFSIGNVNSFLTLSVIFFKFRS